MVTIFFTIVITLTLFVIVSLAILDIEYHKQDKIDRRRSIGEIDPKQNNGDYYHD